MRSARRNGNGIVFQPQVGLALMRGADAIVNALKPTLGPLARTVLVESGFSRNQPPNALTDAGTIARRVVELPDRDEDVGAMMLRHALWRVRERAGDGVATTAVIFQAMAHKALAYIAAGGSAMRLRNGILLAAETACQELARQSTQLETGKPLDRWLRTQCEDRELADALAQVFAKAGASSYVRIENAHGRTCEYEFLTGALWGTGWHASPFPSDEITQRPHLRLHDAHVVVSDLDLSAETYLRPLMMTLVRLDPPRLLVVCRKVSNALITLFTQARQRGLGEAVFVNVPTATGAERVSALQDIAVLTGATLIPYLEPGIRSKADEAPTVDLEQWLPHSLGRARTAWANPDYFGIDGGKGNKRALRAHLANLVRRLEDETDPQSIAALQEQIARLNGGTTILRIGAATEAAQKERRELAERLVRLAGQVTRYGVVPGAGAALVNCQPAVRTLAADETEPDVRYGIECVAGALEAPLKTLAMNAGLTPASVVHETRSAPGGSGYDLRTKRIVDLQAAGILDSTLALQTAVRTAASAVANFITVDVIVHRRKPDYQFKP